MTHFVTGMFGSAELVNLDKARRITVEPGKHVPNVIAYDDNGDKLGELVNNPEEIVGVVVPAAAGAFAYVVTVDDPEDGSRPSEAGVWVATPQIVAWRVDGCVAMPVFVETRCRNETVLIPDHGEAVREPESGIYKNLGNAKSHLLIRAQSEWDRKQVALTETPKIC